MATKKQAQIHMDDQIVNDPELESLLEERQELKVNVSEYKKVNKKAQEKICKIEIATPYRIGRFIISTSTVEPKTVAFETAEATRINIKTVDEQ